MTRAQKIKKEYEHRQNLRAGWDVSDIRSNISFKPQVLNAILRCFRVLDSSDQWWLLARLDEERIKCDIKREAGKRVYKRRKNK